MHFDATFTALVALILFFLLLWYLKVPGMIAAALDKRSAEVAQELSDAQRLREEAAALKAQHEAQLARAESEATAIVANAKEQATAIAAEARVQMQAEIGRRQKQAEESIARAEQQASAEVRAAAAEAAVEAAEKILRGDLSADVHARLVDEGAKDLAKRFA
jgi:F-type H+-transporting ATPase subunit b